MSDGYEESDRGFRFYTPIDTSYGHELEVSESSRAGTPCLWLWVDSRESVISPEQEPKGKIGVHLTLSEAAALRSTLDRAMDEHYQLRDIPTDVVSHEEESL